MPAKLEALAIDVTNTRLINPSIIHSTTQRTNRVFDSCRRLHATMAAHQDLQNLLRLQTARKMPIKDAMGQIRALQSVNLRRYGTS